MKYADTHVTGPIDRRLSEAAQMGLFDDDIKPISTSLLRADLKQYEREEIRETIGGGMSIHLSRPRDQAHYRERSQI